MSMVKCKHCEGTGRCSAMAGNQPPYMVGCDFCQGKGVVFEPNQEEKRKPMKPITVAEVKEKQFKRLPEFVVEAINELIVECYSDNTRKAAFAMARARAAIERKQPGAWVKDCNYPENQSWLDPEKLQPVYGPAGWVVSLYSEDRPCADPELVFTANP